MKILTLSSPQRPVKTYRRLSDAFIIIRSKRKGLASIISIAVLVISSFTTLATAPSVAEEKPASLGASTSNNSFTTDPDTLPLPAAGDLNIPGLDRASALGTPDGHTASVQSGGTAQNSSSSSSPVNVSQSASPPNGQANVTPPSNAGNNQATPVDPGATIQPSQPPAPNTSPVPEQTVTEPNAPDVSDSTPTEPSDNTNTAVSSGQCKAAPAIAAELLHGSSLNSTGKYISQVAREMGPQTNFNGISACDAAAYRNAIAAFLAAAGAL